MTKISQYSTDNNIRGNDKWIGSDSQNYLMTKNFTPNNLADYFNGNNVIDIGTSIRYTYQTLDPGELRAQGTISFETEIGPQVNFSDITTFLLAKNTLKGNTVTDYLDFLIDSKVLLSKSSNINIYGYYKITSIEPWIPDTNFFVVTVEFLDGNGFIYEDLDYLISLVDKVQNNDPVYWGNILGNILDQTDLITYIADNTINLNSLSAGTGISYNNLTGVITNTAPDQTVVLTAGTNIGITGTYPNFTINNTQSLSGYVPTSRTLTINGTSYDLSVNRSWSITPGIWGSITGTITAQTDLTSYLSSTYYQIPTGTTLQYVRGDGSLATFPSIGIPTLQDVLDNNHDLVDGNNFQGTDAGDGSIGINNNGFGEGSLLDSSGNNNNALGAGALDSSNGDNNNAFGYNGLLGNQSSNNNAFGFLAGAGNLADNTNSFGYSAGFENTFKNVNLFGFNASADADNQNVFSKWISGTTFYLGRLSFNNITANRKWELPDASGTIALTSDIPSITPSALTKTDDTNVTLTLGGSPNTALLAGVSLTLGWTGTLADNRIASAATWNAKVTGNPAITGATKTKITYDSKGLVTSGADATTADIADSTNKRYVTDAQLVVIGNTSGTNTGDETNATIKTKLGAASTSTDGYLTSTDWNTFNGKQSALSGTGVIKSTAGTISYISGTSSQFIKGDGSLDSNTYLTSASLSGYVPYTGATTTLNLGANDINAQGIRVTGVSGNGHLTMRWQSVDPTSQANHTTFFADSLGNFKWKNDNAYYTTLKSDSNTANRVYTFPDRDITIDNITTSTTSNGTGFIKSNGTSITFDNSSYITLGSLSSTATGLTYTNTTGVFSLTSGYVIPTTTEQSNWNTAYTNRITSLTTTGSSGSATLSSNTLNIPTYTLSGLGGVSTGRTLTINGTALDLSADRSWSVGTVTSVAALTLGTSGTDLSSSVATGTTTPAITLNVPTASATNRGVLSSTDWTTFNNKQDKTMSAYSFRVNNTNATANATETTYKAFGQQVYTGSITWTGTTAPSGATNHTYNWVQIGNMVTLKINLLYASTGTALTSVLMTLPSDCPSPIKPTGFNNANNNLYTGIGYLSLSITSAPSSVARVTLRSNSGNNGFEILSTSTSGSYSVSDLTIQYFTS